MMISRQRTSACSITRDSRLLRLLSGLLLAFIAVAPPVSAASIPLNFVATATTIDAGITTVAVGDQFLISLVVDDSVVDTNASVGAGTFTSLVTSFNMVAMPGNVGTWVPSGTVNLPASNFVTNAFGNGITFQIVGSGFPNGGVALAFQDFEHTFSWLPGLTDSGSGDTFAQQLGTFFGVPPAAFSSFSLRFTGGEAFPSVLFAVTVQNATPVPVPTLGRYGVAALMLTLGWIGWRKWTRKAST